MQVFVVTPDLEPAALTQLIKQARRIRVLELALATMVGWAEGKPDAPGGMYDLLYEEDSA